MEPQAHFINKLKLKWDLLKPLLLLVFLQEQRLVGEEIATLEARVKATRVELPPAVAVAYLTHLGCSYDNPVCGLTALD